MAEFAHQVGFRQALGCNREGRLTARGLPQEAALIGIEAQFAPSGTQIVVIATQIQPPVGQYADRCGKYTASEAEVSRDQKKRSARKRYAANASHVYSHITKQKLHLAWVEGANFFRQQGKHVTSLSTSPLGESDTVALCCSRVCLAHYQKIPGMRRQRTLARYSL